MKYEDCKERRFDLGELGGNHDFSLEELVTELIYYRRRDFFEKVVSLGTGESLTGYCFNAITFNQAIKDFRMHFNSDLRVTNYEGECEYEVVAGDDWIWHVKTTITWKSMLPIVYGEMCFHTEVLSVSDKVKSRNNGMTGTMMEIRMIKNDLRKVSTKEVLERDGIM